MLRKALNRTGLLFKVQPIASNLKCFDYYLRISTVYRSMLDWRFAFMVIKFTVDVHWSSACTLHCYCNDWNIIYAYSWHAKIPFNWFILGFVLELLSMNLVLAYHSTQWRHLLLKNKIIIFFNIFMYNTQQNVCNDTGWESFPSSDNTTKFVCI